MQADEYNFPYQVNRFNWLVLPSVLGKISRKFLLAVTDGYFLAAGKLGAVLTPLVFATGFLWGWKHFGFTYLYTENLWFLLVVVVLGSLSSHLGLLFTFGFILGDFFFSGSHYIKYDGIIKHLGLFISYVPLVLIAVVPAITIKYLVAEIKLPSSISLVARLVLATLLYAALTYFYIYFWANMAAVFIRPVFSWHDASPSPESITLLQNKSESLIWAGVVMAVIRMIVQSMMSLKQDYRVFYTTMESHFVKISTEKPLTAFINPWVKALLYASISAFTLSGILLNWKLGIIAGILAFFLQAVIAGLIRRPVWINKWAEQVYQFPSVVRIVVGFLLILLLTKYIISTLAKNESFVPLLISTCCAFLLLFLLNPGKAPNASANEKEK